MVVEAAAPAASSAATTMTPVPMPASAEQLANASNALGLDLWRRASPAGTNFVMSPASISAALAMTWGGAKGATERQMRAVMHLDAEPGLGASDWAHVFRALASPSRALELRIANRLFGEKTFSFEKPFVDLTRDDWGAPLEPVDFLHDADGARVHVNAWVAKQTHDKIKDLLPPNSVDDTTRLALVNAIYFLADWMTPFQEDATSTAPFHVTTQRSKNVPTMHETLALRVARQGGVSVVELPYRGDAASMWIVLPDRVDGLPALEKRIDAKTIAAWRAALAFEQIELAMPKFEIRPGAATPLAAPLAALGMVDAFDSSKADFTAIGVPPDPRQHLFVSAVFHSAFVKVDEKGTEAAGATAIVMGVGGGAPPKPTPLHVDHPFLFFVVDKATGLVLFMGRVTDP